MFVDLFELIRKFDPTFAAVLSQSEDINVKNQNRENLLHVAIARKNDMAATDLIRIGIDVNAQNNKGETPLHYAAGWNNVAVAEQIMMNGGGLSIVNKHGNTPVWTAVLNLRGEDFEFLELLARHGAARFAGLKNKHNRSPMDMAVQMGSTRLIELLIEHPDR